MTPNNTSKKILYTLGAIVGIASIAVLAYIITPSTTRSGYSSVAVVRKDIQQVVSATGKVSSDQESHLAFDGNGGTVADVHVKVGDHVNKGDVLATLRTDILESNYAGALADVSAANAQLTSLQQGAKPADIALYSQRSTDADTALASAMHDAYLKTKNAIENQTDVFFTNAVSSNPTINVPTLSLITTQNINQDRVVISDDLKNWQNLFTSGALPNDPPIATQANKTINDTKAFLSDLSDIMNNLNNSNSGLSQSQIATNRAIVTSAATAVNSAFSGYTAALSGSNEAHSALTLEQSGATPSALAAQSALVARAEANLAATESQIAHSKIIAPFDGIVTEVLPTVGEVYSGGTPAITVISGGPAKIDLMIPETDVAKIHVHDQALVTLSAYGSTTFPAIVTTISPALTTVQGITAYQTTVHFLDTDPRILSGMTASVNIMTASSTGAITVPARAIVYEGSQAYVLVKTDGQFVKKPVTVGITGSDNSVEITSGLTDGDTVASF